MVDLSQAHIVLIGLRTSGKSSVGERLAEILGREFLDLDAYLLEKSNFDSVRAIFKAEGEKGFRALEVDALGDVLMTCGRVVALGGGTPTAPGAARLLERATSERRVWIVYLRWDVDTLAARLDRAHARLDRPPLLKEDRSAEAEMRTMFETRDPLYQQLASVVVEGEGDVEASARRVAELWREAQAASA